MQVRDAFIRACRTAAQTFVGAVVLVAPIASVTDVKRVGVSIAFAAITALAAGIVAFVQNIAEDNTSFQLPK